MAIVDLPMKRRRGTAWHSWRTAHLVPQSVARPLPADAAYSFDEHDNNDDDDVLSNLSQAQRRRISILSSIAPPAVGVESTQPPTSTGDDMEDVNVEDIAPGQPPVLPSVTAAPATATVLPLSHRQRPRRRRRRRSLGKNLASVNAQNGAGVLFPNSTSAPQQAHHDGEKIHHHSEKTIPNHAQAQQEGLSTLQVAAPDSSARAEEPNDDDDATISNNNTKQSSKDNLRAVGTTGDSFLFKNNSQSITENNSGELLATNDNHDPILHQRDCEQFAMRSSFPSLAATPLPTGKRDGTGTPLLCDNLVAGGNTLEFSLHHSPSAPPSNQQAGSIRDGLAERESGRSIDLARQQESKTTNNSPISQSLGMINGNNIAGAEVNDAVDTCGVDQSTDTTQQQNNQSTNSASSLSLENSRNNATSAHITPMDASEAMPSMGNLPLERQSTPATTTSIVHGKMLQSVTTETDIPLDSLIAIRWKGLLGALWDAHVEERKGNGVYRVRYLYDNTTEGIDVHACQAFLMTPLGQAGSSTVAIQAGTHVCIRKGKGEYRDASVIATGTTTNASEHRVYYHATGMKAWISDWNTLDFWVLPRIDDGGEDEAMPRSTSTRSTRRNRQRQRTSVQ